MTVLRNVVRAITGVVQSVAAGTLKAAETLVIGGIGTVGAALEQAAGGIEDVFRAAKAEFSKPAEENPPEAVYDINDTGDTSESQESKEAAE